MGQFQWGPGTQEGSHRHPVTTVNKFSALSTEDDEDTEIDKTRGQPGEDRDLTLVPDGTIPTIGVVPPGVALQDPLSFPAMNTHIFNRGDFNSLRNTFNTFGQAMQPKIQTAWSVY